MGRLIALGVAAAVIALAFAFYAFHTTDTVSPEMKDAYRIIALCGMGSSKTGETEVATSLAARLREMSTEAKVSSAEVGAIATAITANDAGAKIYHDYAACITKETELALRARGVVVEPDGGSSPAPSANAPAAVLYRNTTTGVNSPIVGNAHDVVIHKSSGADW